MSVRSDAGGTGPEAARRPGRVGRPRRDQAGAIEGRILDAARDLFLAEGFDAARTERIALAAGAGKASLYARFENKEVLFSAVIEREIARAMREVAPAPASPGGSSLERLAGVCAAVVETSLTPGAVALMRLMIGTAVRFPDLAARVDAAGRQRAVERIVQAMRADPAWPGDAAQAVATAGELIDRVFAPLQLRALLGGDLAALRHEAGPRTHAAVSLLVALGRLPG